MNVIVTTDYNELSEKATQLVVELMQRNPNLVLGLATGSSPIGLYNGLIEQYKQGLISFKNIQTVNLDEYVGLDKSHPQSYNFFMHKQLFGSVDICEENVHILNGQAASLQEECNAYNKLLQTLVPDLQILGIGSNGHIGFNEPGTSFDSLTHVVDLTKSTIRDNSRLFEDISQVPTQALTMGIAQIMQAKQIIVLASGVNKALAVYNMVKGAVTTNCPASVLQHHLNCIVIVDKEAAKLL